MSGLFIAFEGGEGVGKSTQIGRAADWLSAAGRQVVETREPGGTPLGRELRRLVLEPDGVISPRAEALIYAADRAHHVEAVLRPALAAGKVVLCDRYVDSTLAYQGAGRGLSVRQARVVTDWATGGLLPHLTVLLDLDPEIGLARARERAQLDRLEAASPEFHRLVRVGFLDLVAEDPDRYLVLDATAPPDAVERAVRERLRPLLV